MNKLTKDPYAEVLLHPEVRERVVCNQTNAIDVSSLAWKELEDVNKFVILLVIEYF